MPAVTPPVRHSSESWNPVRYACEAHETGLVAVPVERGHAAYLDWVRTNVDG
jgi:hypothetical protein